MKINDVISILENVAPLSLQDDFDNSGIQILSDNQDLKGIIVSVDLTNEVVDLAIKENINLIITHHPLFFYPIKSIGIDYKSNLIKKILSNDITVYSAHTNFDRAEEGMIYSLVKILDMKDTLLFDNGYGVIGSVGINYKEIEKLLKDNLNIKKFTGRITKNHYNKLAYINGAGGRDENIIDVFLNNKVDLFITSEIKNSVAINLAETGIDFIELNHADMESIFSKIVYDQLVKSSVECKIIMHHQTIYNI